MTPRQKELLAAIIHEFISTADAVGSVSLNDKYKFHVSPATIRNEMAELVREGYLDKPHSSSGRVPTTMGLRYFLQELLHESEDVDVLTQERVKQQLFSSRFDKEALVREALKFLVAASGNAAVALVDKDIYYAGLSEMLNIPEFQELDNLRSLMVVLEDYATLSTLFHRSHTDQDVKVLIGEETGIANFHSYAVVFADLRMHGGKQGFISIVGPNRMLYSKVIPAVRFAAATINRLASGW